jgi:rubrerythrin
MPLLRASLLKAEPAGTLRSLDELFALAYAMEQEAAKRYSALAIEMRRQQKLDLAQVFEDLAASERGHVDSVARWSQSRTGHKPDASLIRWEGPETFDAEAAAEITTSRLMTPHRALSMAVRNEDRAFAFWSYVAAHADQDDIRQAAEAMAREELGHVAMLRKERRRAYHREHGGKSRPGSGLGATDHVNAGTLERCLAGHLSDLAGRLDGPAAERALELSAESERLSQAVAGLGRFPAELAQRDAQAIAEFLADAYLESAESAGDAHSLDRWQQSAERAIARLAWLRALG